MVPTKRRILVVVLAGSLCLCSLYALVATTNAADTQSATSGALSAVADRQARAVTVQCRWTWETWVPEGSRPTLDQDGDVVMASGLPQGEETLKHQRSLIVDGSRLRADHKGWIWSLADGDFIPWQGAFVYADGVGRLLDTCGALVEAGCRQVGPELRPVVAAYRLLDPEVGLLQTDATRYLARAAHNGHPCLVVEKMLNVGGQNVPVCRLWLAQDMGGSVVRLEGLERQEQTNEIADLEYEPDPVIGWRLSKWSVVMLRDGKIESIGVASDVETHINEPVPSDTFSLSFPAATRVSDRLRGIEFREGLDGQTLQSYAKYLAP